jgi:hypothetical protein
VNKKDLAVYPGSMTTRTREEIEGVVGDKHNKRYTTYLPLWTREEVTISPLGGLHATNHVLGTWRQIRVAPFSGLYVLCLTTNPFMAESISCADIGIGKCGQNKPTNTKTSTKTVNKRGGKMRGRGRGKK